PAACWLIFGFILIDVFARLDVQEYEDLVLAALQRKSGALQLDLIRLEVRAHDCSRDGAFRDRYLFQVLRPIGAGVRLRNTLNVEWSAVAPHLLAFLPRQDGAIEHRHLLGYIDVDLRSVGQVQPQGLLADLKQERLQPGRLSIQPLTVNQL